MTMPPQEDAKRMNQRRIRNAVDFLAIMSALICGQALGSAWHGAAAALAVAAYGMWCFYDGMQSCK